MVDLLMVVDLGSILWQILDNLILLVIYYGVESEFIITHIEIAHNTTHSAPSLFMLSLGRATTP